MADSAGTIEEKLCRFLLAYRSTPHPSTNETPSFMLMKRQPRTRFSALKPDLHAKKDTEVFEKNVEPKFSVGATVFVLNLLAGSRWLPGVIVDVMNRSYNVQVGQSVMKRHEDQVRARTSALKDTEEPLPLVSTPFFLLGMDPKMQLPTDHITLDTPLQPSVDNTPTSRSVVETTAAELGKEVIKIAPTIPDNVQIPTTGQVRRNPERSHVKPARYREE